MAKSGLNGSKKAVGVEAQVAAELVAEHFPVESAAASEALEGAELPEAPAPKKYKKKMPVSIDCERVRTILSPLNKGPLTEDLVKFHCYELGLTRIAGNYSGTLTAGIRQGMKDRGEDAVTAFIKEVDRLNMKLEGFPPITAEASRSTSAIERNMIRQRDIA